MSEPSTTPSVEEQLAEAREWYTKALEGGLDSFFEPRQSSCPWCRSTDLKQRLRSRELIQLKPGEFTIDQCRRCGHAFQNPRLNLAGLDFYYRDFYDGLGADIAEAMFAMGGEANRIRARSVSAHTNPESWLDVGTGHGHFPLHAKEVLPDTVFDGLDLSAGVTQAQELGRIRVGHRGLFPELAPSMPQYDVVSMHHYLEHTRDPREELDALAAVVKPGGYAEIEMPDVFSAYGRALRSWWVPWFPPQHQHFLPTANLLSALRERDFTTVSVQRGESHSPVDLTFALIFLTTKLAPDPRRPWAPPQPDGWRRKRHELAWTKVFPPLSRIVSKGDVALGKVLSRLDQTNTYRIVARKEPS
ncbi:MAG: class I SAM-dependent methyltransferase [Sporichthyaceae bacterium]